MKMSLIVRTIVFFGLTVTGLVPGVEFLNLNFEATQVPPVAYQQPVYQDVLQALPGWRVFHGSNEATLVYHNGLTAGSPVVTLFGPGYPEQWILGGSFSAGLFAGIVAEGTRTYSVDTSILQRGLVPDGTQLLRFKAHNFNSPLTTDMFAVYLDQQPLSLTQGARQGTAEAGWWEFEANVSGFAGQEVDLKITSFFRMGPRDLVVDDVQFVISEPSAGLLLVVACAGLAAFVRRVRNG